MYIPLLMCTQHPDSTVRITAQEEVDEAVVSHLAYGCDEYMVDYEGKATPYSQPRDVVAKALSLGLPLGERFFITPRIPNPRLEDFGRSMLALEASLLANAYSRKEAGVDAVKWIILPMTEDVDTMAFVYKAISLKAKTLAELEALKTENISLVPLVEDAVRQLHIDKFVRALFRITAQSGYVLEEMRVFLGISDSAVRHGHVASALAVRRALALLDEINRDGEYKVWPIIGMGSPPFRGGVNNPRLVEAEATQYGGYKTATIQSAVRYDVSYKDFVRVREVLTTPRGPGGVEIDPEWVEQASKLYKEAAAPHVEKVVQYASVIPSTRDRVSWKQYGRSITDGKPSVPRAIVYTATWYFMGLPPTFLDYSFIKWAYERGVLDQVLRALPALKAEWEYDSAYYSPTRAMKILGEKVVKGVEEAMDILGVAPRGDGAYLKLLENADSEPHGVALSRMRGFLG